MTKEQLHDLLKGISEKWKFKLEDIGEDKFRLDVAIKMKDDSWRYQFVYVWIKVAGQESYIYMNSRIGEYNTSIDLYKLMIESGFCKYSAVTILPDNIEGKVCESLCVSASPHAKIITQELLDIIIYDVAFNADFLEKLLFGEDKN